MSKKIIVIVGPTASGKSSLGIEVAKKINGIIISADSMQIYKGLDIGTAKVTPKEAGNIKHELIDICDITENFDVATYKSTCYEKIDEVLAKGKTPIIVGGTGLYINSVVNNVCFDAEEINLEVQKKVNDLEQKLSQEELYEYLCKIDEESAKLVDRKNKRRVLRAIYLKLNGSSKALNDQKTDLWKNNNSKYEFLIFYIDMPRTLLYDRINKRIDDMVKEGIVCEAKKVYDVRNLENNTASQAIGYKEFFGFIEGEKTLEECTELLKLNTRHYAKRQITWFKKLQNKIQLDGTEAKEKLVEKILKEYYENKT